jgi:hypothetical protein
MKKLLLMLLCLPMIGFGQMLGSISSLTISPVNPNNTDTVYIYAELLFTSSDCPLDMKSHSVLGNNIVASTQHCLGMLTTICNTTDTFKLNPLAVGTYTFDLTLSSGGGGPPCTAGIVPDDNDIISFSVVNSVGIEEQTTKKELLRTTDLLGRETTDIKDGVLFYIYDDGTVEKKIILE